MNSISALPAAIYYIRPEIDSPHGTFVYGDVDVPTAPFGLSDTPNGISTKGYREMEITLDGTSLANDVFAWGFGYGSQTPVFDREQRSTSQNNHGLWQTASINYGVYKQGTINRIANSIVDGSPTSHRGAKDDRPYVTLVTYNPGLLAGHVVQFESNVWGFSDAIPVRQLTLTFQAPDVPRYELILSHEIDAPWGFIDQFWPTLPPLPGPPGAPRPPLPPGPPQPVPTECDCGITDTFSRTVASTTCTSGPPITGAYWGIADCGITWAVQLDPDTTTSVNGTQMLVTSPLNPGTSIAQGYLSTTVDNTGVAKTFEFTMDAIASSMGGGSGDVWDLDVRLIGDGISGVIHINPSGSFFSDSTIGIFGSGSTSIPNNYWQAATTYTVTMSDDGTDTTISITNGTTGYSYTATGLVNIVISNPRIGFARDTQGGSTHPAINIAVDNVTIPEIDRCMAVQFDDFNRLVSASAGTSTPSGILWSSVTTPGGADYGVNGAELFCGLSGGTFRVRTPISGGPWQSGPDTFTFETRFSFFQQSGVLANFEAFKFEMIDTQTTPVTIGWTFQIGGTGGGFLLYSIPSAGTTAYALPSAWLTLNYSSAPIYFHVKWEITFSTGFVQAKVWKEIEGEPVDWQVIPLAGFFTPMDKSTARFNIELTSSFANRAGYVDWVQWSYDGQACFYNAGTPVGPPTTPPSTPLGWGCEYPTKLSNTVFSTSATFIASSTFVWKDGILQERGVAYTEGSNGRSLTFASSVGSSVIRACYFSEGFA
jgi:hypothetical protein